MKVKDFKKLLAKIDPEYEVIMSKDAEGNYFSPFSDSCFSYYVPDNTYSGYLYEYDDDERSYKPDNAQEAVVLWPTN